MITIKVQTVSRRTSCTTRTVRHTYENGCVVNAPSPGGEWETVDFMNIEEEKPTITVANVQGRIILSSGMTLTINDPLLFETFKAGDIVELRVVRGGVPMDPQIGKGG